MNAFERIYQVNAWNGVESASGPGSGSAATAVLRGLIVDLVEELGITSVLDVGCGDGFWMPDLPGYIGVDVAPRALELARARHPERDYRLADATADELPWCEMAIVRDAIQHLSLMAGLRLIENVRRSGAIWLLASTYQGGPNVDIAIGDAYTPDLEAPPFLLGDPWRLMFDGHHYHEHGTDAVRDPSKHLALWRL